MGQLTNKEFDGTMFIAALLFCFAATVLFTFLKPEFAALSTTEKAFEIFENLFMIIVGYLFKKAVDSASNGSNGDDNSKKE